MTFNNTKTAGLTGPRMDQDREEEGGGVECAVQIWTTEEMGVPLAEEQVPHRTHGRSGRNPGRPGDR